MVKRKTLTYNKKVIPFPEDGVWTFWDFVQNDSNPIEDWYEGLSEDAQNQFNDLLKDNRKTEKPIHWIGFRGFLRGQLREERIWELGFYADSRQYRILGKFHSVRKQAILLCGCYHKGHIYTPPDALDLSYRRSKALTKGEAILYARQIKDDI